VSVVRFRPWAPAQLEDDLRAICDRFPITRTPNESQTEDDLIWPVLQRLGWTASLRQQNLSDHGRDDVPDGILFADENAKARANSFTKEWKRYQFGLAAVESKRWQRPLDRRSGRRGEETAPSTQMLRYLRRIDDLTGKLRWGILTNGVRWRLYYQGARHLRARLDAVFFHLYGVTDRDDVRYVYSTFPIVERQEAGTYGSYRSRDLCLAYMNALIAGDPDARITM
jgi:hypothetical protein